MHLIQRPLSPSSALDPENQIPLYTPRRHLLKLRWRAIADDGTEFGFDLASRLTDGCVIFQQDGKDYVVRQVPELVYEVIYESPAHAALVAWRVGQLHLPAQILPDRIRVLHDHEMSHLLGSEGWSFTEPEVVFQPLKPVTHAG